ncbi:MAG: single-stranded DNA-binding protein [Burkholderiaceae bacterium]|nr:MAG: single-stranded DNA-binding protein [Burkholderiaceae bacterium]
MGGINKHIILGFVGKDPEIRYLPKGDPVAQLSVATTSTWKDKDTQERKERTEWHRVIFYGKNLIQNFVEPYVKEGSQVYIEGEPRTRSYEKDGVTRYVTEIHGEVIQLLDRKPPQGQPPADDVPLP